MCYPNGITVTEQEAYVDLQNIVNHTASRLLQTINNALLTDASEVTILYKWGFDGSSGHAEFRQPFESLQSISDSSVIITSLVPVQVLDLNRRIVWQNLSCSSTR